MLLSVLKPRPRKNNRLLHSRQRIAKQSPAIYVSMWEGSNMNKTSRIIRQLVSYSCVLGSTMCIAQPGCGVFSNSASPVFPQSFINANGHDAGVTSGHGLIGQGSKSCTYYGNSGSPCNVECLDNWASTDLPSKTQTPSATRSTNTLRIGITSQGPLPLHQEELSPAGLPSLSPQLSAYW